MKIRPVGTELFHAGGGRTDMTQLIVAFRNFANAPIQQLEHYKEHKDWQRNSEAIILNFSCRYQPWQRSPFLEEALNYLTSSQPPVAPWLPGRCCWQTVTWYQQQACCFIHNTWSTIPHKFGRRVTSYRPCATGVTTGCFNGSSNLSADPNNTTATDKQLSSISLSVCSRLALTDTD